jgi:hypothetical protein
MRFGDYDNVRRQILIMLRGQTLTPLQVDELKAIITVHTDPGLVSARAPVYLDESGPMPKGLTEKMERLNNAIDKYYRGYPTTASEALLIRDSAPPRSTE